MPTCMKRLSKPLAALLIFASFSFTMLSNAPVALASANDERTELGASFDMRSFIQETKLLKKNNAMMDPERASDFYFAQNASGRCTITSIAMMVRRAAFIDDDPDWTEIGISSVTRDGWTSAGAKNVFSTSGYDVSFIRLSGADSIRELLADHPEGIAAYDPGVPHAVLITDYDENTGTFYCADPAGYYSGGRVTLAETWNGEVRGKSQDAVLSGFRSAWIVS